MSLIKKKISNHPILIDLERVVVLEGFVVNSEMSIIEFYYSMEYFKEGEKINMFEPLKRWVIDNSYKALVRDEELNLVPNPDFNEDEEVSETNEQYVKIPAFTYFKQLVFESVAPISIKQLIEYYILDNDKQGFYNN